MVNKIIHRYLLPIACLSLFIGLAIGDGYVPQPPEEVVERYSQSAVIKFMDGIEELYINAPAYTESSEIVLIMPFPSDFTVMEANSQLFEAFFRISNRHLQMKRPPSCDYIHGCAGAPEELLEGFEVVETGKIGSMDYEKVYAESVSGFTSHIIDYYSQTLPASFTQSISSYIKKKWQYFFLGRFFSEESGYSNKMPGLKFVFPVTQPVYPVNISKLNDFLMDDIFLYVLSNTRYEFNGADAILAHRFKKSEVDKILEAFPFLNAFVEEGIFLTKLHTYIFSTEDIVLHPVEDNEYLSLE